VARLADELGCHPKHAFAHFQVRRGCIKTCLMGPCQLHTARRGSPPAAYAKSGTDEPDRPGGHEIGHAISRRPTEDGTSKRRRSATKEYKKAAKLDGGLAAAITNYGSTKWDEHFSESFAMFTSEPDTLKALRPHTHAHFETLTGGL
jgi:hypothetical protein